MRRAPLFMVVVSALDATDKELEDRGTGTKSSDSGVGVDVKRFYFTVIHDFDAVWSATFQTDIGDQGSRRYDVYVKQANIQAKINSAAVFRLGSASTAWIPYVEGLYGFRYMENTLTDYLGFGTSADWGLHFLGKTGIVNYQLSAENGRGFSNPARSKGVDFEGRLTVEPIAGLNFALGGYSGRRGLDTDATPALHRATRTDALIAYAGGRLRVGGEWFAAKDWNQVTQAREDKGEGFSTWASYRFTERLAVLGRFDHAKPSQEIAPDLEFTYYNAGLELRFNKAFAASLVYKHAEVEKGSLSTTAGTLGSTQAGAKGDDNEVGLWTVYDF
jgi:hypothetical protein